ncbi:MAG: agmatinase family protein [Prevotellaceae bacterium]|jgi:agmatinase|nr:agmatinase family protein [Prevotellaceae bacterium]
MPFNPNNIGIPNGSYFALPFTADNALLALLPVPWDATTSYRPGAANAPQAILAASPQIDLFDLDNGDAWTAGIYTLPESVEIRRLGRAARRNAEKVIALLEKGADENSATVKPYLDSVNKASSTLNSWVYGQTLPLLRRGQPVGLVGGDHSTPLGYIRALGEVHESFGILHIDAHADLRKAYEGFEFSHASIMYNVIKHVPSVKKLVQVGVRDLCKDEAEFAESNPLIEQFNDYRLHENFFNNITWGTLCEKILVSLPQKVYISFDIDGLSPDCCPNTGTPVPGGLSFHQASYLLKQLVKQGKTIVGFDLCEVAPDHSGSEWDATVGARVLYKLCGFCIRSHEEHRKI